MSEGSSILDAVPPSRPGASDWLALTKARLTLLAAMSAVAGLWLGSDGPMDPVLSLSVFVGAALASAGASALNMWIERRPDARMARTQDRPSATGRLSAGSILLFGASCAIAGVAGLWLTAGLLSAAVSAATVALYLGLYTPMKRWTSLNTLVGAVPGALPPLIGFAAGAGTLADLRAFWLFSILFLWQIPHFLSIAWIYRHDYARGGFVMLPLHDPDGVATGRQIVLHSVELLGVSLLPAVFHHAGPIYFAGALALGVTFTAMGVAVALRRTDAWAKRHFRASIVYLPALLLLLVSDKVSPR